MTEKRYCPECGALLVCGQRAVYGSRESAAKFAMRKYCSIRCAYRAAGRKQYAKLKAR